MFIDTDSFVLGRENDCWAITDKFEGRTLIFTTDEVDELMSILSWINDKAEDIRNR